VTTSIGKMVVMYGVVESQSILLFGNSRFLSSKTVI